MVAIAASMVLELARAVHAPSNEGNEGYARNGEPCPPIPDTPLREHPETRNGSQKRDERHNVDNPEGRPRLHAGLIAGQRHV